MVSDAHESAADRRSWERSSGESAIANEAFRRFRDLGPHRSLAGARSIERRWSWCCQWAVRAAAWDDVRWRRLDEAVLVAVCDGLDDVNS